MSADCCRIITNVADQLVALFTKLKVQVAQVINGNTTSLMLE